MSDDKTIRVSDARMEMRFSRNAGIGTTVHYLGDIPFNTIPRGESCRCAVGFSIGYHVNGSLPMLVPVFDHSGFDVVFKHITAPAGSWHRADECEVPEP